MKRFTILFVRINNTDLVTRHKAARQVKRNTVVAKYRQKMTVYELITD